MYIYFDTNGTIKEIVNDKSIRNGSNEANKIYCYLEGEPEIDDIWYLQKLPSGELSNEVSFKNSTITKAIPYDAKRDMKYFKDFEQYKFYVFTLNTFLTSQKGLNIATIRVSVDNTIWALGELTFNVEENVIKDDNGITQSQYDYLLLAYANRTLNATVGQDLDALIEQKIDANLDANLDTQIEEHIEPYKEQIEEDWQDYKEQVNGKIENQNDVIAGLGQLRPSGVATSTEILDYREDKGIWIGSDTGHWYYWSGTQYVDGGVYQATEIPDLSIDLVKQSTYTIGANKYNKDNVLNGYYSYSNGGFVSDNNYKATNYFIPIEPSTDYKLNGVCHICWYDVNKTFISGEVKTYNWLFTITSPSNAYYCRLSPQTARYENFFFKKATDTSNYEPFIVNYKGFQTDKEYDYNKYRFAYVRDEKVCVNKVNDNQTASYITIDFEVTPTKISTKFVCDDAIDNVNTYGTLCVACHRLSAFRIQSITDRSLHLVIYGGYATLTCLGQVYGHYYYATLFNVNINSLLRKGDNNPNELELTISGNDVTMTFNGSEFTGTFTDTHDNDLNLSDFIGQYVTIEHYCDGDRNTFSMPSYTEFKVLGSDASKVAFDNFKREDGILTQMPSGHKYYLMTNEFDGNKIFNE